MQPADRKRINFREANKLIRSLQKLDQGFEAMFRDKTAQETAVREACERLQLRYAADTLATISVDELKNSKAGIRTAALKEAGYENLKQVHLAKDWQLQSVSGIGEKQVESIRNIISSLSSHLCEGIGIHLSIDDNSTENTDLIRAIAAYRRCEVIREDAKGLGEELHLLTQDASERRMIRNTFMWIFSGRERKDYTQQTLEDVVAFCSGPQFARTGNFLSLYEQASGIVTAEAIEDFEKNSVWYYSLIEKNGYSKISKELIYSSIPAQLAARIDEQELDLSCFRGDLRSYQSFGVKYILSQKNVLLGDEMGLGKTVEAIAAMSDIRAREEKPYFLIVCPASVLVNWCREIAKFSSIQTFLIHGPFLEEAFSSWQEDGGAAVTNYEMMGRIIRRIDKKMRLSMLIIDEAHYIKNPKAQRTRYIRRLDNESDRILLMTGTPLENHVMEMCSLIDFIRPDLSDQVRAAAAMSHIPEFKEMLAPVYLRRQRSQVLEELPPITEKQEWCTLTPADEQAYQEAAAARNFNALRRVSFLQDDPSSSSKAQRLLEICAMSEEAGRKILVYSWFRETVSKVASLLGERCTGTITGSVSPQARQELIDHFSEAPAGSVLVCQVQAGGMGLNIQSASVILFCEPQIKPSLTSQAISRAYRMGQVRNVIVSHLLCEGTVDEAVMQILEEKQLEFDIYADESAIAGAMEDIVDSHWIRDFLEKENRKYLPAVVPESPAAVPENTLKGINTEDWN